MTTALFPDLVINGEVIPHCAVAAEAQNHSAPRGKPGLAWRAAANALAMRALLLQEARRRELVADPRQFGPGRFEVEEEALIRQLLEAAIEVSSPNEQEIWAEWEKDPDRYRSPPLWEVSHILCACDPLNEVERVSALTRAKSLTSMALASPKGFAALATRESDCGSKSSGGALGQLGPGDTDPEFEVALRQLDEGQITPEPVLTRHGYHVIRLDAVAEGERLPYPAVRQKISDAMEKSNWVRRSRDFVDQLIAEADISGAELKPA